MGLFYLSQIKTHLERAMPWPGQHAGPRGTAGEGINPQAVEAVAWSITMCCAAAASTWQEGVHPMTQEEQQGAPGWWGAPSSSSCIEVAAETKEEEEEQIERRCSADAAAAKGPLEQMQGVSNI